MQESHVVDIGLAGVYPHEWFDICASADRHATTVPEMLHIDAKASAG